MLQTIKNGLAQLKKAISKENESRIIQYEIISHTQNHHGTGETYVTVLKKFSRKTFLMPVSELYSKTWLDAFSGEDSAFLGVLYLSDKTGDTRIASHFPLKKQGMTKNIIFIGMLFSSFLILSNLTAFKVAQFKLSSVPLLNHLFSGTINFPAALIFFPLTYFFDDTLTEVYGFRVSRYIIWAGLICNTLFTLGTLITVALPPSSSWHFQQSYALIYDSALRIFIASSIGYFFGEFINSMILSKMKVATAGKWLWLRAIMSSSVGVLIDSIIFCHIASIGVIPTPIIWQMIVVQYALKIGFEILALPFTYILTGYLKQKDSTDYYDYSTRYNPFSLSVNNR